MGRRATEEGFVSQQPHCLGMRFPIPAVQTFDPGCKGVGGLREKTVLDSEVRQGDLVSHWRTEPSVVRTQALQDVILWTSRHSAHEKWCLLSFPWFVRAAVISQGQSGLWPRKTSLLSGQKEVSGSVTQTQMLGDPAEVCHSFLQLCVAVKGLSEVPVWEKHPFFLNGSVPSRGVIW